MNKYRRQIEHQKDSLLHRLLPLFEIHNYYIIAPSNTAAPNPASAPIALFDLAAPETNGLGLGDTPVPDGATPLGAPVPLANGAMVVVPITLVLT